MGDNLNQGCGFPVRKVPLKLTRDHETIQHKRHLSGKNFVHQGWEVGGTRAMGISRALSKYKGHTESNQISLFGTEAMSDKE